MTTDEEKTQRAMARGERAHLAHPDDRPHVASALDGLSLQWGEWDLAQQAAEDSADTKRKGE